MDALESRRQRLLDIVRQVEEQCQTRFGDMRFAALGWSYSDRKLHQVGIWGRNVANPTLGDLLVLVPRLPEFLRDAERAYARQLAEADKVLTEFEKP